MHKVKTGFFKKMIVMFAMIGFIIYFYMLIRVILIERITFSISLFSVFFFLGGGTILILYSAIKLKSVFYVASPKINGLLWFILLTCMICYVISFAIAFGELFLEPHDVSLGAPFSMIGSYSLFRCAILFLRGSSSDLKKSDDF